MRHGPVALELVPDPGWDPVSLRAQGYLLRAQAHGGPSSASPEGPLPRKDCFDFLGSRGPVCTLLEASAAQPGGLPGSPGLTDRSYSEVPAPRGGENSTRSHALRPSPPVALCRAPGGRFRKPEKQALKPRRPRGQLPAHMATA